MQYINRFEKKITLTRRLKTWNYKLNNFDWYILVKLLIRNIKNKENAVVKTHEKKIRNLTKNSTNPFTHTEVVKKIIFKTIN